MIDIDDLKFYIEGDGKVPEDASVKAIIAKTRQIGLLVYSSVLGREDELFLSKSSIHRLCNFLNLNYFPMQENEATTDDILETEESKEEELDVPSSFSDLFEDDQKHIEGGGEQNKVRVMLSTSEVEILSFRGLHSSGTVAFIRAALAVFQRDPILKTIFGNQRTDEPHHYHKSSSLTPFKHLHLLDQKTLVEKLVSKPPAPIQRLIQLQTCRLFFAMYHCACLSSPKQRVLPATCDELTELIDLLVTDFIIPQSTEECLRSALIIIVQNIYLNVIELLNMFVLELELVYSRSLTGLLKPLSFTAFGSMIRSVRAQFAIDDSETCQTDMLLASSLSSNIIGKRDQDTFLQNAREKFLDQMTKSKESIESMPITVPFGIAIFETMAFAVSKAQMTFKRGKCPLIYMLHTGWTQIYSRVQSHPGQVCIKYLRSQKTFPDIDDWYKQAEVCILEEKNFDFQELTYESLLRGGIDNTAQEINDDDIDEQEQLKSEVGILSSLVARQRMRIKHLSSSLPSDGASKIDEATKASDSDIKKYIGMIQYKLRENDWSWEMIRNELHESEYMGEFIKCLINYSVIQQSRFWGRNDPDGRLSLAEASVYSNLDTKSDISKTDKNSVVALLETNWMAWCGVLVKGYIKSTMPLVWALLACFKKLPEKSGSEDDDQMGICHVYHQLYTEYKSDRRGFSINQLFKLVRDLASCSPGMQAPSLPTFIKEYDTLPNILETPTFVWMTLVSNFISLSTVPIGYVVHMLQLTFSKSTTSFTRLEENHTLADVHNAIKKVQNQSQVTRYDQTCYDVCVKQCPAAEQMISQTPRQFFFFTLQACWTSFFEKTIAASTFMTETFDSSLHCKIFWMICMFSHIFLNTVTALHAIELFLPPRNVLEQMLTQVTSETQDRASENSDPHVDELIVGTVEALTTITSKLIIDHPDVLESLDVPTYMIRTHLVCFLNTVRSLYFTNRQCSSR